MSSSAAAFGTASATIHEHAPKLETSRSRLSRLSVQSQGGLQMDHFGGGMQMEDTYTGMMVGGLSSYPRNRQSPTRSESYGRVLSEGQSGRVLSDGMSSRVLSDGMSGRVLSVGHTGSMRSSQKPDSASISGENRAERASVSFSDSCPEGQGSVTEQILAGIQELLASQQRLEAQLKNVSTRDGDDLGSLNRSEGQDEFRITARRSTANRPSRVGLPGSWPACVNIRAEVDDVLNALTAMPSMDAVGSRGSRTSLRSFGSFKGSRSNLGENLGESKRFGPSLNLPIHPNGNMCLCWDCLGFIVLMHDIYVTPFLVAWEVPMAGSLLNLSFLSTCYWIAALVMEFNTGYYQRGELIMSRPAIARRYLRGWFPLDVSLNISDLVVAALHVIGESSSATKILIRVSKICRLLKVVRLVRVSRVVNKVAEPFVTTRAQICAFQGCKVVFSILIYNHCVCCAWYMTGRSSLSQGVSWLQQVEGGDDRLYQYLTSFHWTLAQMTPGPIGIGASNSVERLFNCILLITGMLFASSIVSLVTGQIMQLIILQRDKTQKLDVLRTYLRQNAIKPHLASEVQRQVTQRLEAGKFLEEKQVSALQYLSVQMKEELAVASRRPHLLTHCLFQVWADLKPEVLREVSLNSTSVIFQPAQDALFSPGNQIPAAYFLVIGQVQYTQKPETSMVTEEHRTSVRVKSWICEAALWSTWQAVGLLESLSECHFIAVDAKDLFDVLSTFPNVAEMTKHYARAFHLRIVSAVPPHAPWPSDLVVPFTEGADLLSSQVGIRSLQKMRKRGVIELTDDLMEELEDEVRKEKCAIEKCADGKVQRIVAVVALRVYRQDSRFLAQLGSWDKDKGAKLGLTLPGTKRRTGELPQAAFQRVLNEDLSAIKSYVVLSHIHHQSELKQSQKFPMPALYNRAVHYCNVTADEEISEYLPAWQPQDGAELPIELHATPKKGGYTLFGWVTDEEFGYYSTKEGGQAVMLWLQLLGGSEMTVVSSNWGPTFVNNLRSSQV